MDKKLQTELEDIRNVFQSLEALARDDEQRDKGMKNERLEWHARGRIDGIAACRGYIDRLLKHL